MRPTRRCWPLFLCGLALSACTSVRPAPAPAAPWPQTRPERTGYTETTRYDEAMAFLEAVVPRHRRLKLVTMGTTNEERRLPLVVWGDVPAATPEAIRASGKTVVYLQGNIHAGEVEGKEALLELVRALAQGQHADLARHLVLLINPIYNADGNERVALGNRPLQLGPIGGMGQRPNAQNLDLNRDMMKLASPEARALVRLLDLYAPHVLVDLHTTNGSYHGYHLTYSPGLHPSTPPAITELLQTRLFPRVAQRMQANGGFYIHNYGNLNERPGVAGWTTFDHRARFVTNYAGLIGKVSILSEAYSYDPFETRIRSTRRFVEEILAFVNENAAEVRRLVEARAFAPAALRADLGPPVPATILLDSVRRIPHPTTGAIMLERVGNRRAVPMEERVTFVATETTEAQGYLVPDSLRAVRALLELHGVRAQGPLARTVAAQRFRIDTVRVAPRAFQGVQERAVTGRWEAAEASAGHQVFCTRTAGPLLAVLLDPRSDDGVANWAVLGTALDRARTYPVLRADAACARP